MPKYFARADSIGDKSVLITGENATHLIHSLRARPGESVIVCDGAGTDYHCRISEISARDGRVVLSILQTAPADTEPETRITLYQALSGKMEIVIQKCVEMGVWEIIPVMTDYTATVWSEGKHRRYEKITEAAAKQSMRGIIPRVAPVLGLQDALADSTRLALALAAYENEKKLDLKTFLRAGKAAVRPKSIGVFVGPEGGFSPREAALLQATDIATVSLGKRILRTETAGLAVLTAIMYEFDELGVDGNG
ncbi:MAG: 16S rRNA (uracil(1498)-N(3))-methyltransferase [Clostridiales bacterium]|jgi:16S rRNA (uracil1498-N3)-methyltransferase|nr:16S rRNA (uracil(1498)-N(3))-methyltransferase [Clostridiales bacterium]